MDYEYSETIHFSHKNVSYTLNIIYYRRKLNSLQINAPLSHPSSESMFLVTKKLLFFNNAILPPNIEYLVAGTFGGIVQFLTVAMVLHI